jgi:hypothetical protein
VVDTIGNLTSSHTCLPCTLFSLGIRHRQTGQFQTTASQIRFHLSPRTIKEQGLPNICFPAHLLCLHMAAAKLEHLISNDFRFPLSPRTITHICFPFTLVLFTHGGRPDHGMSGLNGLHAQFAHLFILLVYRSSLSWLELGKPSCTCSKRQELLYRCQGFITD